MLGIYYMPITIMYIIPSYLVSLVKANVKKPRDDVDDGLCDYLGMMDTTAGGIRRYLGIRKFSWSLASPPRLLWLPQG